MADTATKLIYNVEAGEELEYVLEVDKNNEILANHYEGEGEDRVVTHFLKFPNVSEEEVDELIAQHNESAMKQVKKQGLFGGQLVEEPEE